MITTDNLLDYQAPPDLLTGKVVLVTGAADGIGRAVAKSYAAHGAQVLALDKKQRRLETLYDEITAADLPEPILVVQDLHDLDAKTSMQIAAGVQHDCGRLDGLLHNAAEFNGLAGVHRCTAPEWDRLMAVNLRAPFLLTQALLPILGQANQASVLFTSADVGRRGRAYWGAYAAAYGGIEILMQVLADELEVNTHIRVNSIDPGPVHTNLRTRAYPGEEISACARPESVVPAYLYMMGDDSIGVHGQALSVAASATRNTAAQPAHKNRT